MNKIKTVPKYFLENIVSPACSNNEKIIEAFKNTPRAFFVSEGMEAKAYEDKALPIGMGQTISQVTTVAHMLHILELEKTDNVLEIGAGSGFVTALLSRLVNRVYAVERIPQLMEQARNVIKSLRIINVSMKTDDGAKGWKEFAPYNKIIASAKATKLPVDLVEQLAENGILLIPINNTLMKYKKENGNIIEEKGIPVSFVDFVGS